MVELIHRRMFCQHFHDGWHGEHVGHAIALHQFPRLRRIEPPRRHQNRPDTPRDHHQLVHPRTMRQRCHDKAHVVGRAARRQIVQMVQRGKGQLPMRQHHRLWPSRRPRGKEQPRRGITIHRRVRHMDSHVAGNHIVIGHAKPLPDADHLRQARCGLDTGGDMIGEILFAEHQRRIGFLRQIGHLVRALTIIRRHPNRPDPPAGQHDFGDLVVIGRLHQNPVAGLNAKILLHRGGQRTDAPIQFAPTDRQVAPDDRRAVL